ncbi:DNRLRE domain-containing protein [Paraglaciecola sp. 2405UD69-4]|uniref:DNRLRE domain-containing protein n=1 Tax=Paraglaciecola sp. 2405UD69-4 TaxID=3391836 RepID=UPI0039C93029
MTLCKCIKAVTLSAILICSVSANASLVSLSPEAIMNVSLDGDSSNAGTVNGGTLTASDAFLRERGNNREESLKIVSFISFDLSSLSTSIVNSSAFSAVFEATFDSRINTSRNLSVLLGQVEDGNTWDDSLDPDTVPLFEWAATSLNSSVLVNNVRTDSFGLQTIDVTEIVRSWVTSGSENNGFVLYGATAEFQGAGFSDIGLQVEVPAPAAIGIFLIALGFVGFRKLK